MEFVKLTDQQRKQFDECGFLVVEQAIDRQTVAALTEVADAYMEAQRKELFGAGEPPNYYFNQYFDLTQHPVSRSLITHAKTLPLVVQLLSPEIRLLSGNFIYKYPQPSSPTPVYPDGDGRSLRNWHRDLNNFASNHPIRTHVAIRVTFCLTDFTQPNSGVTLLVPGSHTLTEPLQFNKPYPEAPEADVDPPQVAELSLEPGDAYLFSTLVYHTPAVNFTDQVAKIAMANYAYDWWRSPIYDVPPASAAEGLDDIGGQLLGQRPGPNTPLAKWAEKHGIWPGEYPMRVYTD